MIFLDIELREINGIDFGIEIKSVLKDISVVFVTAYPSYALDAFKAYPLDYIVKPVDEERLVTTLNYVNEVQSKIKNVCCEKFYIHCFGKFEIICGNDKVRFPTKKAKEFLAFLLCNEGITIYRDEIARIVFSGIDNCKNANNLRVTLFRIKNSLHDYGVKKSEFMICDDLSVEIIDGVCDIVDFMRFVRENMRITDKNIAKAEKIADLLKDEFLSDIDACWITEKREYIMIKAEELLINMSVYYLLAGFLEKTENILLHLLSINPLSEQGYYRLLDLYIKTNNVFKYRTCYERYRQMIEKEIGERPLKYYREFYEKSFK